MKSTVYWNIMYPNVPTGAHEEIFDTFMDNALKSCSWYRSLDVVPFYLKDALKKSKLVETLTSFRGNAHTMKTCPGVKDLMHNALVVKSPADLCFSLQGEAMNTQYPPREQVYNFYGVSDHPEVQHMSEGSSHLKDKRVFKFSVPIGFACDDPSLSCVFMAPTWHNIDNDLHTASGVVAYPYTKFFGANIQTFIDPSQEYIYLKKGQALAYMYFSKPIKLVYDAGLTNSFTNKTSTFKALEYPAFRPSRKKWWRF